jgi:hypothetical protein
MTLKNSAVIALAGMLLLTALMIVDFITNISNVLGGLVPAVILFRSVVYVIASLSVTIFFLFFYKAQA